MNNIRLIIASAATVIVAASASLGLSHQAQIVPTQQHGTQIVRGANPDFSQSPYLIVNGTTEDYQYEAFKTGTSTICSFPAPYTGSSTIQYITWRVTGNTNPNTLEVDIGTSTANNGTTTATLRSNISVVANVAGYGDGYMGTVIPNAILAGSGSTTSSLNSQFVNVVVGTTTVGAAGTTGALNWTGWCQLETTRY